jgi:DNA-binding NtrC family response regulator
MKLDHRLVLVVEDEPIIGLALEDMLGDAGATVVIAERVEDAFAIVEREEIGAAILDVNVHGVQSYGLADRLARSGVPYIFATGYGDLSHPPEFAHVPTVTKPYNLHEIERALTAAEQR